jgi:hypothetical protein
VLPGNSFVLQNEQITSSIVWIDDCVEGDALFIPASHQLAFMSSSLIGPLESSITNNAPGFPPCSVRIVAPASAVTYTNVLRQVRMKLSSDNPSAGNRKIVFALSNNNDLPPYDVTADMSVAVIPLNGT